MNQQTSQPSEKSIGDIIRQANNLSSDQVERVLAHQKESGLKFGEAAVALGFIRREDVLWALSQQFHYPYTAEAANSLASELVVATRPFSDEAEVFRDLRSQLLANALNGEGVRRALAVISPNTGDGKSFFCANLAVAFSQLGGRTLLVDADMRTPRLHEIFGITSNNGLSSILSGRSETNVIRPIDDLPSLYLLPVGITPPNPLELVQKASFGLLLNELLLKFDYVIVDTPAATHGADARVIAAKCGAVVAVGRKAATRTAAMQKLLDSVSKSTIKVAGVVLNDV